MKSNVRLLLAPAAVLSCGCSTRGCDTHLAIGGGLDWDSAPPPQLLCTAQPTTLAQLPGQIDARWIAHDDFNVYVVAATSGASSSIWRIPHDLTPPSVVATTDAPVDGLSAAPGSLFESVAWASGGTLSFDNFPPDRPIAMGRQSVGAVLVRAAGAIGDDIRVYWSEVVTDATGAQSAAIYSYDGTRISLLRGLPLSEQPRRIVNGGPLGIAWTTALPLATPPVAGSVSAANATDPSGTLTLLADGAMALWGSDVLVEWSTPNELLQLDLPVRAPHLIVTQGTVRFVDGDVWLDEVHHRFLTATFGDTSSSPVVVAMAPDLTNFVVDGKCVVWLDPATGSVDMIAHP